MLNKILNIIHKAHKRGEKLFAVLIDPEKCNGSRLTAFVRLTEKAKPDFIFIGGSQIKESIDQSVRYIKSHSSIPTVLFIGDAVQFSPNADAMLFLSLISGRNPDLLIGQHVLSARTTIMNCWPGKPQPLKNWRKYRRKCATHPKPDFSPNYEIGRASCRERV